MLKNISTQIREIVYECGEFNSDEQKALDERFHTINAQWDRLISISLIPKVGHEDASPVPGLDCTSLMREQIEMTKQYHPRLEEYTIDVDIPHRLLCAITEAEFAHISDNLLDNAAKYSRGYISVSITRHGEMARIVVENDGNDLPEDEGERERLKEYGVRVTKDKDGDGAGLYLIDQFAKFRGGRLWTPERRDPEGARIVVELPLAETGREPGAARPSPR